MCVDMCIDLPTITDSDRFSGSMSVLVVEPMLTAITTVQDSHRTST